MKGKIGNDLVDFWEISKSEEEEDWVKELFEKRKIHWNDLMPDVFETSGTGGIAGWPSRGSQGDYLIKREDGRLEILSPKSFAKLVKPLD